MGTMSGSEKNLNLGPVTRMCGCLAEDTQIRMGDGSLKRISDIRIGERIMQPENGRPILVQNIWKGWEEELIFIRTEEGSCAQMTKEHPVYQGNGFIRADELKAGDTVYGEEGQKVTVVSVDDVQYGGYVCNLDLKRDGGNGTMLANGIVVGDNRVQNGM